MSSIYDENLYQITLVGNNLVPGTTNKFIYQFPSTVHFKETKVALSQLIIPYSWFNISSALGNNSFSYTFTTLSGTSTYAVLVPDGYYSIDDLNSYLQSVMLSNGHYLVDSSGNNVFYLQLETNPSFYAVQVNCFPLPTSLPSGYSNPASISFPASPSTPQLIVPSTNFRSFIGFAAGSYPSTVKTSSQSALSSTTPNVNPVQSLFIQTNLVNNKLSNPSNILYPFSAVNVAFGGLIDIIPPAPLYLDVVQGYYTGIEITFVDQSFDAVALNDSNIVVQLAFRTKK